MMSYNLKSLQIAVYWNLIIGDTNWLTVLELLPLVRDSELIFLLLMKLSMFGIHMIYLI